MPNTKECVQCDECKQWIEKEAEYIFDRPYFRFPQQSYWFLNLLGANGKRSQDKWFCSWLCTKNFVDRMYTKHHKDAPQ